MATQTYRAIWASALLLNAVLSPTSVSASTSELRGAGTPELAHEWHDGQGGVDYERAEAKGVPKTLVSEVVAAVETPTDELRDEYQDIGGFLHDVIHQVEETYGNEVQTGSGWNPFHHDDNPSPPPVKNGITFERTETTLPILTPSHAFSTSQSTAEKMGRALLQWNEGLLRSFSPLQQIYSYLSGGLFNFYNSGVSSIIASSPQAKFDKGHCESSDQFGDNSCHYDWGDDINIQYDAKLAQELNEDFYLVADAKIDNMFHVTLSCPICAPASSPPTTCPINLPIPLLPESLRSIVLPPCPISAQMAMGEISGQLPPKNPVPYVPGAGLTTIEGTVWLKRKSSKSEGERGLRGDDVDANFWGYGDGVNDGGSSVAEDEEVLMEIKGVVKLK